MVQTLNSVQSLRAFAALWVVLFHINVWFNNNSELTGLGQFFSAGWAGVPIFFVISGFIMWYTTNDGDSPAFFAWKRVTRIYTALIPAVILFIIANGFTRNPFELDAFELFNSFTLLSLDPRSTNHFLYVTWTLTFELVFYVVFAFILFLGKRTAPIFGALTIVIVEFAIYMERFASIDLPRLVTERDVYGFIIGCVAARAAMEISNKWLLAGLSAIGILLLTFGTYFLMIRGSTNMTLFFCLGTGFLLSGVRLFELAFQGVIGRWLGHLGDASYAIYLLHPAVILALNIEALRWRVTQEYGVFAFLAIYLLSVILVSFAYYKFVERPLLTVSRAAWTKLNSMKKR